MRPPMLVLALGAAVSALAGETLVMYPSGATA